MRYSLKRALSALGMFAIVAIPAMCWANDESDRARYSHDAETMLATMIAKISGLDKDSDAQDAVEAVKLSQALSKKLDELEKIQGDNAEIKKMVSEWSHNIKPFQDASVDLAHLKNLQATLAKPDLNKCPGEQKKLDDVIKKYLPGKDPIGMVEIPKVGKSTGEVARTNINKADDILKMSKVKLGEANSFHASGDAWQKLADAVHTSASKIHDGIAEKHKSVQVACGQLAMGDRNPEVLKARKEIIDATDSELSKLHDRIDKWEAEAVGFFKTDCEAMQRMNEAFCNNDIGDSDAEGDRGKLFAEAGKIQREVKTEYDILVKEKENIEQDANKLLAKPQLREATSKILNEMKDEIEKIHKANKEGALLGVNNPAVQFYLQFGKKEHKAMEASHSCDVRDTAYPGSSDRPDCVRAKGCVILEFKPNSSNAISMGKGQLGRYKKNVELYYNNCLTNGAPDPKKPVEAKYGGAAIMQAFGHASCIKGGKLSMNTEVVSYNRCSNIYQCLR